MSKGSQAVRIARGPDGTKGFAPGRGRPLPLAAAASGPGAAAPRSVRHLSIYRDMWKLILLSAKQHAHHLELKEQPFRRPLYRMPLFLSTFIVNQDMLYLPRGKVLLQASP